jgi:hypothetical protein
VTVPFGLNNIDDKREWYYLRNQKDDTVVAVLMSIYCDYKDKNTSMLDGSNYKSNKHDISCDVIRGPVGGQQTAHHNNKSNNSNNSFAVDMGKTKYTEIKDQFLNNSAYTPNKVNYTTYHNKIDNTVIYNDGYKSDNSYNLFSPYSYRVDKSNIEPIGCDHIVLESRLNELNSKEDCMEVYHMLKEGFGRLKAEQDRSSRVTDEINREKESM